MRSETENLKKQIIETGRMLYRKDLIVACDGNISVKLDSEKILITSSGICKGFLDKKDILTVDTTGKVLSGSKKPSVETQMHLFVYKNRPDIKAVIHAHPPLSTALSISGKTMPQLTVNCALSGKIPIAKFALPGTKEVIKAIKPYILKYETILLSRHGALAFGYTLQKVYFKMENLEHCAKIHLAAKIMGKAKNLTVGKVQKTQTKDNIL